MSELGVIPAVWHEMTGYITDLPDETNSDNMYQPTSKVEAEGDAPANTVETLCVHKLWRTCTVIRK